MYVLQKINFEIGKMSLNLPTRQYESKHIYFIKKLQVAS